MKMPKVADIVGIINKIAPPELAEAWDNPGLQIGNPFAEVTRVMVALDPAPDVIDAAIAASCQLLVTHHPLIFKPLKSISAANPLGSIIQKAFVSGMSIVTLHTNYDIADGGLNDVLARMIGLSGSVPLRITSSAELVKLVVYVPVDHLEQMRSALFPFVARQGNYCDCSFAAEGTGTFTPLDGAQPFSGTVGLLSRVAEERLELLIAAAQVSRAVKALLAVHPYEEPAFDLYPLVNKGVQRGLGRIGRLPESLTLAAYADRMRSVLSAPALRYVGDPNATIAKVALCSGSGASLLRDAVRAGADVLVTGDVKYHEAREAEESGLALIDAGHFPTEIIMVHEMAARLERAFAAAGYADCIVEECRAEADPFRI
jgi:dinuclear metal center YbgI/SA1388 family protein